MFLFDPNLYATAQQHRDDTINIGPILNSRPINNFIQLNSLE